MKVWLVKAYEQGMGADWHIINNPDLDNSPADPVIVPEEIWEKLGYGDEPVYANMTLKKTRTCKKHMWYDYEAEDGKNYRCCEKCGMCIKDKRTKAEKEEEEFLK